MATEKRERQRRNRSLRIAAAEQAAKKAATARRVRIIGSLAVVVAVIFGVLAFLQRDNGTDAGDTTVDSSTDDTSGDVASTASIQPTTASIDLNDATASDNSDDEATSDNVDTSECPAADGSDQHLRVVDFESPQPECIQTDADYVAVFDTSEGEMRFNLRADDVPGTVNNFVTLARWGYYDDTLLFRTDPSIDIIQGGSPHTNSPSDPGPGYTIADEPEFETNPNTGQLQGPYRYEPGQLVMARSAGPDSASAQFFVTTGSNASLLDSQGTYVVFGTTDAAGLSVAQSIIGLHEDTGNLGGQPSRDVTIHSVTIEQSQ